MEVKYILLFLWMVTGVLNLARENISKVAYFFMLDCPNVLFNRRYCMKLTEKGVAEHEAIKICRCCKA